MVPRRIPREQERTGGCVCAQTPFSDLRSVHMNWALPELRLERVQIKKEKNPLL